MAIDDKYIRSIKAREIINARGIPAVEVDILLENGMISRASAPAGVSVSEHEAIDLRDGGNRFMGKGVLKAVENINTIIASNLKGIPIDDQQAIDQLMIQLDGTPNKSNLGGNAITAVSIAAARGGANYHRLPLYQYLGGTEAIMIPIICPNLISGSKTANNHLDFEDFLVVPFGFDTFTDSIRAVVEVFHVLYSDLCKKYGTIGQITALAPPLFHNEDALDYLSDAINKSGYSGRIGFGIDVASNLIYNPKTDLYELSKGSLTREELIAYYCDLCKKYPIKFIEDGLHENDFEGFALMRKVLSTLIVGDDLFATDASRLQKGSEIKAGNAILIKVNQVGTISQTFETTNLAKKLDYTLVASTRSGETEDPFQADLAVSIGAMYMKTGCPFRGEMVTKWNRMMEIETQLGEKAIFYGRLN